MIKISFDRDISDEIDVRLCQNNDLSLNATGSFVLDK